MEGQKALGIHQKYLNLCSEDEQRSYGFRTIWGRVINDRIFRWTNPLTTRLLSIVNIVEYYSLVNWYVPVLKAHISSLSRALESFSRWALCPAAAWRSSLSVKDILPASYELLKRTFTQYSCFTAHISTPRPTEKDKRASIYYLLQFIIMTVLPAIHHNNNNYTILQFIIMTVLPAIHHNNNNYTILQFIIMTVLTAIHHNNNNYTNLELFFHKTYNKFHFK